MKKSKIYSLVILLGFILLGTSGYCEAREVGVLLYVGDPTAPVGLYEIDFYDGAGNHIWHGIHVFDGSTSEVGIITVQLEGDVIRGVVARGDGTADGEATRTVFAW